jgi:D-glycerate 3-kinase
LRQTDCVVYLAMDSFVPLRGKAAPGLEEFLASLEQRGIPVVWVSGRSRLQLDEPCRRFLHGHPFIGENGCAVYLPEGYFNVKPDKTLRLGRFTSIPIAQPLPAALDGLQALASDADVTLVPLRSLSPRELVQNSGLRLREADLERHRDFDELFFFAGASEERITQLQSEAAARGAEVRPSGQFWSFAVGASLERCIRSLSKLYDRALRRHLSIVGVAPAAESGQLFPCCDRSILLTTRADRHAAPPPGATQSVTITDSDGWEQVFDSIDHRA